MFPDYWMNELRASVNIVDVVGEYVDLKKKSGRYWGLCPFHGEKTASFSVNEDKQFYYCFGCHAGGDAIKFLRENQKLSYVEAITYLANKVGMTLPDVLNDEKYQKEREQKQRLLKINRDAARFYFDNLKTAPSEFGEYLNARKLSPKTVVEFGIGAAIKGGNSLYKYLEKRGHSVKDMIYLGLVSQKNKNIYDYFRNRLIFPIVAVDKNVIGFGARAFGDEMPKYLNSRESVVFSKRSQLYGLFNVDVKNDSIVLVEGYFDVISLHQHGVKNAVATLGTAISSNQARLIKRYASRVYIAYDGDQAGINATLRAIDILEFAKTNVFVLAFENGIDPDDYIKKNGSEAFETIMRNADSGMMFKIKHAASGVDMKTPGGREIFAKAATKMISKLSPIEQERYVDLISDISRFSTEALVGEIATNERIGEKKDIASSNMRNNQPMQYEVEDKRRIRLEQILISLSMESQDYAAVLLLNEITFAVPAHAKFLKLLEEKANLSHQEVLGLLDDEDSKYIARALSIDLGDDKQEILNQSIDEIKKMDASEKLRQLQYKASAKDIDIDERRNILLEIRKIRDFLDL